MPAAVEHDDSVRGPVEAESRANRARVAAVVAAHDMCLTRDDLSLALVVERM